MILVVGSINMDVNIRVKSLPKPGETVLAKGITQSPGGKGANQAVAAAKSGGYVVMLGCVGQDEAGDALLQSLREFGVNTEYIKRTDEVPSSKAYINISDDSENHIVVDSSANFMVSPEYIASHEELFKQADYCIMQLEIPGDSVYAAEKLCQKYGVKVVWNPSPIDSYEERLLEHVDTLVVNETEGEVLSGIPADQITEADWNQLMEKYDIRSVVQTLGSRGSKLYVRGEEAVTFPAVKCDAIDTTGAGDTFLGALITMFSEGKDAKEAFRFAAVASGIEVTRRGTQSAMPTRDEVLTKID